MIFIYNSGDFFMKMIENLKKESIVNTLKAILLVLTDIFFINFSSFFALFVRFEFDMPELVSSTFLRTITYMAPITTAITIGVFIFFKLYKRLWKYASVDEFITISTACVTSAFISTIVLFAGKQLFQLSFPKSYPLIYTFFLVASIWMIRFSSRLSKTTKNNIKLKSKQDRIMIIGAGGSGATILQELQTSPYAHGKVVCLLDKDPQKIGKYIHGVKVVNNCDHIKDVIEKYRIDQVILAIPNAPTFEKRAIVDACQQTKCKLNIVPAI